MACQLIFFQIPFVTLYAICANTTSSCAGWTARDGSASNERKRKPSERNQFDADVYRELVR